MEIKTLDRLWEEALKRGQYLDEVKILAARGQKPPAQPNAQWLQVREASLQERRAGLEEEHRVHQKILEILGPLLSKGKLLDLFSGESLVPLALLAEGKVDHVNLLDSGESDAPQVAFHLIQKLKLAAANLQKSKFPSPELRPLIRKSPQITVINSGLVLPPTVRRPDLESLTPQEKTNPRLYRARHLAIPPSQAIHNWNGVLTGLEDCKPGTMLHAFDVPYYKAEDQALHDYVKVETKRARGSWKIVKEDKIEEALDLWHFQFEKGE